MITASEAREISESEMHINKEISKIENKIKEAADIVLTDYRL